MTPKLADWQMAPILRLLAEWLVLAFFTLRLDAGKPMPVIAAVASSGIELASVKYRSEVDFR